LSGAKLLDFIILFHFLLWNHWNGQYFCMHATVHVSFRTSLYVQGGP